MSPKPRSGLACLDEMRGNKANRQTRKPDRLEFLVRSIDELSQVARNLASRLLLGDIVILTGHLGAGKTTLTQQMAGFLGVTALLTSPTYTYIHTYNLPSFSSKTAALAHIDLYRVDTLERFQSLGLDEFLGNQQVINIVEWGEKFSSFFPYVSYIINIEPQPDDSRVIKIEHFNKQFTGSPQLEAYGYHIMECDFIM